MFKPLKSDSNGLKSLELLERLELLSFEAFLLERFDANEAEAYLLFFPKDLLSLYPPRKNFVPSFRRQWLVKVFGQGESL